MHRVLGGPGKAKSRETVKAQNMVSPLGRAAHQPQALCLRPCALLPKPEPPPHPCHGVGTQPFWGMECFLPTRQPSVPMEAPAGLAGPFPPTTSLPLLTSPLPLRPPPHHLPPSPPTSPALPPPSLITTSPFHPTSHHNLSPPPHHYPPPRSPPPTSAAAGAALLQVQGS